MILRRLVMVLITAYLGLAGCAELMGPAPPTTSKLLEAPGEYRLGVGDVISIRIYGGEEELRLDRVRVNDPGVLTLPFGEFTVFRKTTRELETAMVQAMKGGFLLNPKVWINIEEYRPFYVQGQVGRPGAFPYQPGLTVNKAVTIAGGFRDRASKNKIFVLREQDKTNTPIHAGLNAPVGPGDTVTVEESFF
jgi:protein involved in polysaccharide export with SLBB domain